MKKMLITVVCVMFVLGCGDGEPDGSNANGDPDAGNASGSPDAGQPDDDVGDNGDSNDTDSDAGDDSDDNDVGDDDAGNGEDNNGEPEWGELSSQGGWTHMYSGGDSDTIGAWIEEGYQELPDSCDGDLGASADSEGLALAYLGEPIENVGTNDMNGPSGLSTIEERLNPRPDLDAEPSPIYRTSFDGRVRDYDENDDYDRLVEVFDTSFGSSSPVRISTCRTVAERGACYVPGDEFSGTGCASSPNAEDNTLHSSAKVEASGDDWVLSYSIGYECMDYQLDDSHPDPFEPETDIYFGDHRVIFYDPDGFEQGEVVALTSDDFAWEASYKTEESCQDLRNPGLQCTCKWMLREITDLERGWAIFEDDAVYLELKATVDDEDFFVWGRFEVS